MTERRKRPKPAAAGRVVATGVSASALLGMVAGLTIGDRTAPAPRQVATTVTPARDDRDVVRVVVRVHHPVPTSAPGTATAPPPVYRIVPAQQPVRRVYVHQPAPVTTTSASH